MIATINGQAKWHLRDVHFLAVPRLDDDLGLWAEVGRVGREWFPAEGGVVLHEAPVALDVGHVDAVNIVARWL